VLTSIHEKLKYEKNNEFKKIDTTMIIDKEG